MNTSHAIVTVGNESRKRTGAQTRQLKEARTLPVSTKFYKRLTDKVLGILKEIHAPQLAEPMIEFIDRYLADREVAPQDNLRYSLFIIFTALRPEIDAAIERSAAARRRAAERREARSFAAEAKETGVATTAAEEICVNVVTTPESSATEKTESNPGLFCLRKT